MDKKSLNSLITNFESQRSWQNDGRAKNLAEIFAFYAKQHVANKGEFEEIKDTM